MVPAALAEAVSTISGKPVLWVPGLAMGCLAAMDILLQYYVGTFFLTRVWFIEALAVPFLVAGAYSEIRNTGEEPRTFRSGAVRYYFRVLVPLLVVAFAILATIVLLAIPLSFLGNSALVLPYIILGSAIPIAFFTFFSDCAAVFEDCRAFESIRRSVEVVLNRPGQVIVFFLAAAGIAILVTLPLMVIWTGLLYENLVPLASMEQGELQALTMETVNGMLGPAGIGLSALFVFIWFTLAGNILLTFKAVFYRHILDQVPQAGATVPLRGEYDEKGRWYKY
ncbi:MAG: hypothetical protein QHH04_09235 [Methanolinea sp.]|nr:hypothetical protein [Methanolinea sp.]